MSTMGLLPEADVPLGLNDDDAYFHGGAETKKKKKKKKKKKGSTTASLPELSELNSSMPAIAKKKKKKKKSSHKPMENSMDTELRRQREDEEAQRKLDDFMARQEAEREVAANDPVAAAANVKEPRVESSVATILGEPTRAERQAEAGGEAEQMSLFPTMDDRNKDSTRAPQASKTNGDSAVGRQPREGWHCPSCTYVNSKNETMCSMCSHVYGSEAKKPVKVNDNERETAVKKFLVSSGYKEIEDVVHMKYWKYYKCTGNKDLDLPSVNVCWKCMNPLTILPEERIKEHVIRHQRMKKLCKCGVWIGMSKMDSHLKNCPANADRG
jgi:hypothetical protein